MKKSSTKNLLISFSILAVTALILAIVIPESLAMRTPDLVKQGKGVTEVRKLSHYFAGIAGTRGDTEISVLDSGKPGGSALILGGTHGNEPAGYMAAILFVPLLQAVIVTDQELRHLTQETVQ